MAVTVATSGSGLVPGAPPAPTSTPPPVGGPAVPTSLFEIMMKVQPSTKLDTEGAAYVKQLKDMLLEMHGLKTTLMVLPYFEAVLVYNSENDGMALIMQETVTRLDSTPATDRAPELVARAAAEDVRLGGSIVVTKKDYQCIRKLVHYLSLILRPDLRREVGSINVSLLANAQLVVNADVGAVREFVQSRSPHNTIGRIDCGFVVSLQTKSKDNALTQVDQQRVDEQPLFAVGAYTEFLVHPTPGGDKYVPIVTINEIATDFPSLPMLGMILPVAAEVLIIQNRWQAPYGFGADSTNLGNLFQDAEGRPHVVNTPADRDNLIRQYFLGAYLAINVTDGRARIPGLDQLVAVNDNTVVAAVSRFLNQSVPVGVGALVAENWPEFTGIATRGSAEVDSHMFDYLYMIKNGVPQAQCAKFLHKSLDPRVRLQNISEFVEAVTPLYSNRQIVLNGAFVSGVGLSLQGALKMRFINAGNTFDNGINGLIASGAGNLSGFSLQTAGSNPFAMYNNLGYRT